MKSNWELFKEIWSILKNNWIKFLIISIIFYAATWVCGYLIGYSFAKIEVFTDWWVLAFISSIIIYAMVVFPLDTGLLSYFLHVSKNEQVSLKTNLIAYKKYFTLSVRVDVIVYTFISLWSLLLIIPGIIRGYSYMMTKLIALDTAKQGALELITDSRKLMDGYKSKLFFLMLLSGMLIVGLFTIGVGVFVFMLNLIPSVRTFLESYTFEDYLTVGSSMGAIIGAPVYYLVRCIFYRELKKEHSI